MPDEEKIEEETYSLIFSSLKHPIRRKILRMLAREPRTFSEILEAVSIDSGHLNYHLENLGDLITHSPDGKYGLSSIGTAAVKLMSGVEEHPPLVVSLRGKGRRVLNFFTKISLIVLILALIASSLFFIGFVQSAGGTGSGSEGVKVAIAPNQIFEYNITIVFEGGSWEHRGGNPEFWKRSPLLKTITEWETGTYGFIFDFNVTWDAFVRLYDPTGMIDQWRDSGSSTAKLSFIAGEITQSGTYRLQIQNIGSEPLTGRVGTLVNWDRFERPYFYWGVIGLLIASAYPALALVRRSRLEEPPPLKVSALRPIEVKVITVFGVLGGFIDLYFGCYVLWVFYSLNAAQFRSSMCHNPIVDNGPWIGSFLVFIGIIWFVFAYGFWSGRLWAWAGGIIFAFISIVKGFFMLILEYFMLLPEWIDLIPLIAMALISGYIGVIYCLSAPEVQRFFDRMPPV